MALHTPTYDWPKSSASIDIRGGVEYSVRTRTSQPGGIVLGSTLSLKLVGTEAHRAGLAFAVQLLTHPLAQERQCRPMLGHLLGGEDFAFRVKEPDLVTVLARQIVARNMHDRDRSWCEMVLRGLRDDCPEMRIAKDAIRMSHIPADYVDQEEENDG